MINYNFPETKFVAENTPEQQLDHIRSEVDEAGADFAYDRVGNAHRECIDAIHSAETLLRMLVKEHGEEKVLLGIQTIIKKNEARGYYEKPKN